ncbi:MAG: hypothetical protein EBZ67_11255 [Chitinophagia bacterium]|nr:hypothetical protein [Chitinophagia bacterium]
MLGRPGGKCLLFQANDMSADVYALTYGLDMMFFFRLFCAFRIFHQSIKPIPMEESIQIKLFTGASAVMEKFLVGDVDKAFSGFTEDFRFSDSKGIFRNDVFFFHRFLKHLESSPQFHFRWKMRRYVGKDIEAALYFSRKGGAVPLQEVTIMAWVYMPTPTKASRLSLDYDPAAIISELSEGKVAAMRNRFRYMMGRYTLEF